MSKQVRLTLPDNLYKDLTEQAEADDRQLANYLTHLLKYIVKKYNKPGRTNTPLLTWLNNRLDDKNMSQLYFPPGVRTPVTIPDNTIIKTIPIPKNPDRETNRNL